MKKKIVINHTSRGLCLEMVEEEEKKILLMRDNKE